MSIKSTCESCQAVFSVSEKYSGQKVRCPKCSGVVRVPGFSPPEPPIAPIQFSEPSKEDIARFKSNRPKRSSLSVWLWLILSSSIIFGALGYSVYQSRQQLNAEADNDVPAPKKNAPKAKEDSKTEVPVKDSKEKTASKTSDTVAITKDDVETEEFKEIGTEPIENTSFPETESQMNRFVSRHAKSLASVVAVEPQGKILGQGTGVFLNNSWVALANYRTLQTSSRAYFSIYAKTLKRYQANGYRGIYTEFDMALVEVDAKGDTPPVSLELATKIMPKAGSEVLLISHRFTNSLPKRVPILTKVVGTPQTSDLPDDLAAFAKTLDDDTDHQWIELDCKLELGLTGGILLDPEGRLLGFASWSTEDRVFVLHAKHIQEMLDAMAKSVTPLPDGQNPKPWPGRLKL